MRLYKMRRPSDKTSTMSKGARRSSCQASSAISCRLRHASRRPVCRRTASLVQRRRNLVPQRNELLLFVDRQTL